MGAASIESTADTDCVVRAACLRHPSTSRLGIFRELDIENLAVLLRPQQVANIAAVILSERKARRRRDEVMLGMLA